jgi:hypothetical protein
MTLLLTPLGGPMKTILALSLLFASFSFAAAPAPYGAFTYKNYLYVTYLADCNTVSAEISVNKLCDKNRLTRNLALSCGTDLIIASTRMICPDVVVAPKVFVFDLANYPIAPEARDLVLKLDKHSVKVKLNRQ